MGGPRVALLDRVGTHAVTSNGEDRPVSLYPSRRWAELARAQTAQQFRNLANFDQLRRRQGTTTVGFTVFSPGGSAEARFSRGLEGPRLGTRRSLLGTPHRRIDEGSSEGTWGSSGTALRQRGGKNPFREHGPTAQTTALGSPPRRDPTPAPSRSGSAPHAPPA